MLLLQPQLTLLRALPQQLQALLLSQEMLLVKLPQLERLRQQALQRVLLQLGPEASPEKVE